MTCPKPSWKCMLVLGLTLAGALVAQAQPAATNELQALRQEISTLRDGQKAMQADLAEIKKLLVAKGAPQQHQAVGNTVSVDGKPFKGDQQAKLTLIEFSEYQCPFCARHAKGTAAQIDKDYVASGKLKHVFQDLTLPSHLFAQKAAEAAHCAGDQGKYWEMHDQLFAHPQALARTNLTEYATAIGLDLAKFQQCLESGQHATRVSKSAAEANKLGLTGTPSFALGQTEADGSTVKILKVIVGAQPYANFQEAIDGLLNAPPRPAAVPAAAPIK